MKIWTMIVLAVTAFVVLASNALTRGFAGPGREAPARMTLAPEKIRSSWGQRLDPSGAIPERGFKALYFNRDNPGQLVFQEQVDSIAIKYAWSDFHNIPSPQFGAYWVGKVSFDKATTRHINVSQSWAKSRILIDGKTVFDASNTSRTIPYVFTAGEHIVEVEFINNWHTVEYKVTIEPPAETITGDTAGGLIADDNGTAPRLYYVGLYESAARDTGVNVTLPRTGDPVVLWLSSYEAIDWNIHSTDRVVNVFVSSYGPGSRVKGVGGARVTQLAREAVIYSPDRRCSCTAGIFSCEGRYDLVDVADKLRAMTNLDLAGYAAKYSAADLTVQRYTGSQRRQVLDQRKARETAAKVCTAKANPNFDDLMK